MSYYKLIGVKRILPDGSYTIKQVDSCRKIADRNTQYDEKGRVVYEDIDWNHWSRETWYTYDDEDRVVYEKSHWKVDHTYSEELNKYDHRGFHIYKKEVDRAGNITVYTEEFDDNGNPTKQWLNGVLQHESTYDENNVMQKSIRYEKDTVHIFERLPEGGWINRVDFNGVQQSLSQMDERGNEIYTHEIGPQGIREVHYTYSEQDELVHYVIQETRYNEDGTEYKETCEHHGEGHILTKITDDYIEEYIYELGEI
jgi:hypothetical protein